MSQGLMIVVTLIYAFVSISEITKGNLPMAIVFGSYAMANVGLIAAL